MGAIANLIEVRALPEYKLWLHYDDGAVGDIDLSQLLGQGVFRLWSDYRQFEQVDIGPHGELTWGDDVELCADALYLELTGKLPEEVFASLRAEHVDA